MRKGPLSVKIQNKAVWMVAGAGRTAAGEEDVRAEWSESDNHVYLRRFPKAAAANVDGGRDGSEEAKLRGSEVARL